MTASLYIQDITERGNKFNLGNMLTSFISGKIFSLNDRFKTDLNDFSAVIEKKAQFVDEFKELQIDELRDINFTAKKYSEVFDKLNDKYHSIDYMNDPEIKTHLKSITRNLHKIENYSHKYLYKSDIRTESDLYLKESLSKLSQETLNQKI